MLRHLGERGWWGLNHQVAILIERNDGFGLCFPWRVKTLWRMEKGNNDDFLVLGLLRGWWSHLLRWRVWGRSRFRIDVMFKILRYPSAVIRQLYIDACNWRWRTVPEIYIWSHLCVGWNQYPRIRPHCIGWHRNQMFLQHSEAVVLSWRRVFSDSESADNTLSC